MGGAVAWSIVPQARCVAMNPIVPLRAATQLHRAVLIFTVTLFGLFGAALIAGSRSLFSPPSRSGAAAVGPSKAEAALAKSIVQALAPGVVSLERQEAGACPGPYESRATRVLGPLEPGAATVILGRARHRLRAGRWEVVGGRTARDLPISATRSGGAEHVVVDATLSESRPAIQVTVSRPC